MIFSKYMFTSSANKNAYHTLTISVNDRVKSIKHLVETQAIDDPEGSSIIHKRMSSVRVKRKTHQRDFPRDVASVFQTHYFIIGTT